MTKQLPRGAIRHLLMPERKRLCIDAINSPGALFTMDEMSCYECSRRGVWSETESIFDKPNTSTAYFVTLCDGRDPTDDSCSDVLRVHWFSHTMWALEDEMYAWCDVTDAASIETLIERYRLTSVEGRNW